MYNIYSSEHHIFQEKKKNSQKYKKQQVPKIVTVVFTRENALKNNSRVVIEFDGGPSSQFRHDKSRGELIASGRCRASGYRVSALGWFWSWSPHSSAVAGASAVAAAGCSYLSSLSAPLHPESTNSVGCPSKKQHQK